MSKSGRGDGRCHDPAAGEAGGPVQRLQKGDWLERIQRGGRSYRTLLVT